MKRIIAVCLAVAAIGYAVVGIVDAQTASYPGSDLTCTNAVSGDGWIALAAKVGAPSGVALANQEGGTLSSNIRVGQRVCWAPSPVVTTPPTTVPPTTAPPTTQPPTTQPPTTEPPVTTVPPTTQPPTTAPPTTVPPTTAPPSGAFVQDFSDPNSLSTFDIQLHTFGGFSSWQGDHDLMCGDANTSRTVNLAGGNGIDRPHGETVYWCRDHMMTSYNGEGYAQLDFSPARTFDNISKVCWDQNMTDLGDRKWTQMVVVPETVFQANGQRLDYIEPGFEDPGANGIIPLPPTTFMLKLLRGSTQTYVGTTVKDENFLGFQTADKARRYKTCVTDLNNGTVRIELERATTTEVRIQSGSLPNGQVRVIFQDVNYNPPKSGARSFTWHWDNLTVS